MQLDDDSYLENSSSHSIGEIKLVIFLTTLPQAVLAEERSSIVPPRLQKVHERSKKAIAHRVKYVARSRLVTLV